jgi:CRISPR-associated protein Cas2
MIDERPFIVSYDISNERRWRRVFRLMRGYGQWIHANDDHVLILDLGSADKVNPRVESLGKTFESVKRTAVVI